MARDTKDTAIYTAYDGERPWDPAAPEKNLLKALLITALADAQKKGAVRKAALEFFLSEDEDYIFSFRSVCAHLDVDPEMILAQIDVSDRSRKVEPRSNDWKVAYTSRK